MRPREVAALAFAAMALHAQIANCLADNYQEYKDRQNAERISRSIQEAHIAKEMEFADRYTRDNNLGMYHQNSSGEDFIGFLFLVIGGISWYVYRKQKPTL